MPGIGPWTVSYIRMRALSDPDAFLPADTGVLDALARLGAVPAGRGAAGGSLAALGAGRPGPGGRGTGRPWEPGGPGRRGGGGAGRKLAAVALLRRASPVGLP